MKDLTTFVMNKKIGAFDLALAATLVAILVGTRLEVVLGAVTCLVFGYAKLKFKGEFSLKDIAGLFTEKTNLQE
jgi:hypothetical protein